MRTTRAPAVDTFAVIGAHRHPLLVSLHILSQAQHDRAQTIHSAAVGGKVSVPHLLPYCMAKFAAVGFSEGLRAGFGAGPVTVTTAVPGLMRTGSHLRALLRGQRERSSSGSGPGASLPLLSMDAGQAARRIVSAMRRRRAEVILTPAAQVGARGATVFPP